MAGRREANVPTNIGDAAGVVVADLEESSASIASSEMSDRCPIAERARCSKLVLADTVVRAPQPHPPS